MIVVEHVVINSFSFLDYLTENYDVILIPKPKTIDHNILADLADKCTIVNLNRNDFSHKDDVINFINKYIGNDTFSIIDIGGYFSKFIFDIKQTYPNQFDQVIEDTENGYQKYQHISENHYEKIKVSSVARSPLKTEEDFLVGHEIVEKSEIFLANFGTTLLGKKALVIGYGKIGSSIAENLRNRGSIVCVKDKNPIRQIDALSHGFLYDENNVYEAIPQFDLIYLANGESSIDLNELKSILLNKILYIFSVTSVDDSYRNYSILNNIQTHCVGHNKYKILKSPNNRNIIIANAGNAINFTITTPTLASFVQLTQAEMAYLLDVDFKESKKIYTLPDNTRKKIATTWLKYYK